MTYTLQKILRIQLVCILAHLVLCFSCKQRQNPQPPQNTTVTPVHGDLFLSPGKVLQNPYNPVVCLIEAKLNIINQTNIVPLSFRVLNECSKMADTVVTE